MLDVPLAEMETITANMPGIDFAPDIMRGKFSRDIADKVQTIPSHHLAHAYSAYWPSGFEEALVLSVDASGLTAREDTGWKTESYSLHAGSGTDLKPIHSERVRAHLVQLSTLGFVYEYVSRKAGFETTINAGLSFPEAGKLMGLAAYGGPQPSWESWLRPVENSLSLEISAYDIFLEIAALEKKYCSEKPFYCSQPWEMPIIDIEGNIVPCGSP
ncbi:MAG: carbamoyltransferase N-terminal domain-containing protein, partial [Roseibacillus sp.]|nr:carbamoyltransferase N-terminal domain-containing protein [Roseibacillus sp.]